MLAYKQVSREIEEEGEIRVAGRDSKGFVVAVKVITTNGETFIVEDDSMGDELLRLTGCRVLISGVLSIEPELMTLKVNDYEVLD